MKKLLLLLILLPPDLYGQTTINRLADSLRYISDMPYICESEGGTGCGDRIFWRMVQHKEDAIPILLDLIADTTSSAAFVPYFGGIWAVGDIAFTALEEIIEGIPTFELLGVPFDEHGCGYCAYWMHLRADIEHRRQFQARVRNWYQVHRKQLVWVTSEAFMTCDCIGKHPNGGHFELRK